jgi:hypothetical protein
LLYKAIVLESPEPDLIASGTRESERSE